MLDEVIFMQVRMFRIIQQKLALPPAELNAAFKEADLWNYIEQAYDYLHIQGDETNAQELIQILKAKGVIS